MSSRCCPICSGVGEVGLGGHRDLDGAPHLGQLADDEPVAGPDLLVGREAHRDHVDLGPASCVTRSLSRSPSSVRGRCRPGVSTRISWASGAVHDAAHDGARGLRLVGGDHDLLADQRVGQRGLAGVRAGRRTTRSRCGSCLLRCSSATARLVVRRPDLLVGLARPPCPRARSGPGRPRAAAALATAAPVAHHVVRRAAAAAAHASGACGSPASARTPPPSRSSPSPSGQSMRLDDLGQPRLPVAGRRRAR